MDINTAQDPLKVFYKWDKRIRIWGALLLGISLAIIMGNEESLLNAFMISLTYTFLYWSGNAFLFRKIREYLGYDRVALLIIIQLFAVFIYNSFIVLFVLTISSEEITFERYIKDFIFGFWITLFVLMLYEVVGFFTRWKFAAREAEMLQQAKAQAEFSALRSQVNPHFLFNSLNTLHALIPEDPSKAQRFVQDLAGVYRYVLQSQHRNLVSLAEEVAFAQTFGSLAQIRYGEHLKIGWELPEDLSGWELPPLSIQLAIENAIKHNVISRSAPLSISVRLSHQRLHIQNPIRPKQSSTSHSNRQGLANLRQRYAHLGIAGFEAQPMEGEFCLKLPLLPTPSDVSAYQTTS